MSTLTGNKISLTYKSLIKTADNDVLTAVLKELSDGLGNNSGVFLNTGGDLKSTGILEFANFKGTSTSVTINKLVNEADGISNNDNDTSLATSAAVKDYVDTHVTTQDLDFSDGTNPGAVDLDSQVFAIVGTSNEIETSASGQQLQIGLPNDVTISGTFFATEFQGALAGTINSGTTATTQTAGDNSTKVATTAYVDTLDAASDLDFQGNGGTGAVNLNTQIFSITGVTNSVVTTASNQGLSIAFDPTGVNLPDNSTAITQTAGDNSTKVATTAYVDVLDSASDLDIAGDTGTGDVNLNTQTFTLSGTTNQVITSVSGQEATFSLPSTVHRNLQGNVTGDLTGNADTATAWETARDLILSSEATGTISNVDGTQNVTGAVTLLNSAVTGKVLTGLPTPAAGNIQSSDTILEAFGKLQSQVSSISNGLIFKGSWDAATNTPTLTSGGGEVDSGTTTGQTAFKLIETGQNFNTTVTIGDKVINQVDGTTALVTVIDSNTQLTLDADIMLSGEAYTIDASPFIPQGNYYVVNYAGTTNLNGITDWSIGDWVIADADNRWSKLDHSQVDGQGTPGHLPVFATATTIGDSIVAQSGTALTVTGSLSTALGASVTGDFAVNTDKFTVAAASGNTAFAGDLAINTNKFTVNATSGNTVVAGDINIGGTLYKSSGDFNIKGSSVRIKGITTNENLAAFIENGQVELYYNNSKKFETTSTGISVLGTSSTFAGSVTATQYNVSNTSGYLVREDTGSGYGLFKSSTTNIGIASNGNVALNFDSSSNATFAGSVTITPTNNVNLLVNDSGIELELISGTNGGTYGVVSNHKAHSFKFLTDGGSGTFTDKLTIDSSGNVGIGRAPDLKILDLQSTSGLALRFYNSATFKAGIEVVTTAGQMIGSSAVNDLAIRSQSNMLFSTGGNAERMRIDSSGNVNITSGNFRLDGTAKLYTNNDDLTISADDNGNGNSGRIMFRTVNSERMRIDSSGNVTIGTVNRVSKLTIGAVASTPNFNDGANNLRIETSSSSAATPDAVGAGVVFAQKYWSGSATLARVGAIYGVKDASNGNYGGGLGFYTQPSGVTTDMVQRMRIDSSGVISIGPSTTSSEIYFNYNNTNNKGGLKIDYTAAELRLSAGESGNTYQQAFYTNGSERMRITSGGDVGIGTDSPRADSFTRGLTIGNTSDGAAQLVLQENTLTGGWRIFNNGYLGFIANNDERMRITSGGDVLLGTQGTPNGTSVYGSAFTTGSVNRMVLEQASSYTGISTLQTYYNPNGAVGSIKTNGSATTFNTSSDYRLKEDLQDFAGLDMVSKIPVYDFKWKTDESRSYGVMAHELQEVLPQAVSGDKDAEEMQSVDYSKIVPLLVKSIQELKAEVDKLKQECKCK